MNVVLNGEPRDLPARATVLEAIERSGAPSSRRGVAVAGAGAGVPRGEWTTTPLREGQRVEVLQAVQGG